MFMTALSGFRVWASQGQGLPENFTGEDELDQGLTVREISGQIWVLGKCLSPEFDGAADFRYGQGGGLGGGGIGLDLGWGGRFR